MRPTTDLARLSEVFRLLGDGSRLAILFALAEEPRTVGALALATGHSPSLVSHHLRLLRAARIVRAERHGRFVAYALSDDHVHRVLRDMADHLVESEAAHGEDRGADVA